MRPPLETPNISVIMPVRNGHIYVTSAIESILSQTFNDFELIVINDYSTDSSLDLILAVGSTDRRIVVVNNTGEPGLSNAMNLGIDQARGSIIAVMDSDDLSVPSRFEKQISYLRLRPDIAIISSFIEFMDENGVSQGLHREPLGSTAIALHTMVGMPFAHPALMMRRDFLNHHSLRYDTVPAADFDLLSKMINLGAKGDNIPEVLLRYRVHKTSDSNTRAADYEREAESIMLKQLLHFIGEGRVPKLCLENRFRHVAHSLLVQNAIVAEKGDTERLRALLRLIDKSRCLPESSSHGIDDLKKMIKRRAKDCRRYPYWFF